MKLVLPRVASQVAVVAERRAPVHETGFEHLPDGRMKACGGQCGESASSSWADLCHPKRFIGVDVADASHDPLTQQQGLHGPARADDRVA